MTLFQCLFLLVLNICGSEERVDESDSAILRTPIVDKMSMVSFVSRNLSSSWYKKIPVISLEGKISVLQVLLGR